MSNQEITCDTEVLDPMAWHDFKLGRSVDLWQKPKKLLVTYRNPSRQICSQFLSIMEPALLGAGWTVTVEEPDTAR